MDKLEQIRKIIDNDVANLSDGYHTFDELYFHRMVLFSIICNQNKEKAWKSLKHADGSMFEGYFIVGINTEKGQFTYHHQIYCWGMFEVQILEFAPEWDGHTSDDIMRLV